MAEEKTHRYDRNAELKQLKTRLRLACDALHWASQLIFMIELNEKLEPAQYKLLTKYHESLEAFSRFGEAKR